jgi:hypothetical protein
MPGDESGQTFYRYEDRSGRVVIVDSIDKLPKQARDGAERVKLREAPVLPALPSITGDATAKPDFHLGSFALGIGAAVLLVAVAFLLKRSGSLFLAKLLGGAALVALLGGLYLGLLRRSTVQSDEVWSSPGAIVNDARRAVDQANEARRKQHEMLEQIQRDAK